MGVDRDTFFFAVNFEKLEVSLKFHTAASLKMSAPTCAHAEP